MFFNIVYLWIKQRARTDPQLKIQRPESFSFYAIQSPAVYWSHTVIKLQLDVSSLLSDTLRDIYSPWVLTSKKAGVPPPC